MLRWLSKGLHQLVQSSHVISKAISGCFSVFSAASDAEQLYTAYKQQTPAQRKTKIVTHGLNFLLNSVYVAASVFTFLSSIALNIITVATDLITLVRTSYITHQARQAVKQTKRALDENLSSPSQLSTQLTQQRHYRFRAKVDVGYAVASIVATGTCCASLVFPPLFFVGLGLFSAVKLVQVADSRNDYSLSRCCCQNNSTAFISKSFGLSIPAKQTAEIAKLAVQRNSTTVNRLRLFQQPAAVPLVAAHTTNAPIGLRRS